MTCQFSWSSTVIRAAAVVALVLAFNLSAPSAAHAAPREFRPGSVAALHSLPAGKLRDRLTRLPAPARGRALGWLRNLHFTEADLDSLHADSDGAIYYVDMFPRPDAAEPQAAEPGLSASAVPVQPYPAGLVFHSRPGAPNVLYLNFSGEDVASTAWNNSTGRPVISTLPFSTDSNFTTFSDAEQAVIRKVWQRVAEDFAPFDIDVTTERPLNFTSRTAMALITRSTDASGNPNPTSSAGGIAYVNVFGGTSFAYYRPAWIYHDNLGNSEAHIAEAASHEIGHNLGLSHDGISGGSDYYGGHGSGETSWGPIMGTGYNRHVTQWSKGEYHLASNTQDDLALLSAKLTYAADDHGDLIASATPLTIQGTNVHSTTPESDPFNLLPENKGTLQQSSDVDVFSFTTGAGFVQFVVKPWITASGMRGGNLDLELELRNAADEVVAISNPAQQTGAQLNLAIPEGTYFLLVRNSGSGSPFTTSPSGYTAYGSLGQYFISGATAPPQQSPASVQIAAAANNPAWGSVSLDNASVAFGTVVQLEAIPSPYFEFVGWTNGASGTANPLSLTVTTNLSVLAVFRECRTTNAPTPLWWLAANSQGNSNLEQAVTRVGANGVPLWQSYVAGLDPNNPQDQFRLTVHRTGPSDQLTWQTKPGRTYTILSSPSPGGPFVPMPHATHLPETTHSTVLPSVAGNVFYRVQVHFP